MQPCECNVCQAYFRLTVPFELIEEHALDLESRSLQFIVKEAPLIEVYHSDTRKYLSVTETPGVVTLALILH